MASEQLSFSSFASYEESLVAICLFSFLGQLILILSFFITPRRRFLVETAGISFLWIGFYYLIHNFFTNDLSKLAFFTGLPFVITSAILISRIVKTRSLNPAITEE